MWEFEIIPRFSETDAIGHINNTVLPVWFEAARAGMLELFNPSLDGHNWPLVVARLEVDFVGELFYGESVTVSTWVEKIGNSSFTICQEASQGGALGAKSRSVLVQVNQAEKRSLPIGDETRLALQRHLRIK